MLADILGEHMQSKHYHVIPQSIILLVVIFIIHALRSYSLCCKRDSKLGWLNFGVQLCFISQPKPQVYSFGRCWMFLAMDALHVFVNPQCLVRQSGIWDPAEVRGGWKCRTEGRVIIKQGWNQEPLCRLSCGNWAWSRLHGHKSSSQAPENVLSIFSLPQSRGKTLCRPKIYPEDRLED